MTQVPPYPVGRCLTFSDLARRPLWVRTNVDGVISELAGRSHP